MDTNGLSGQWGGLAERFRRIANNVCSETDIKATTAVCGPVLPRMRDAGLIPANLILEPSAAELQKHAGQPDVIAHLWSTCWISFVGIVSLDPAGPFPNVMALHPTGSAWLQTDKSDWRIRAENYAAVCDALAAIAGDEALTPTELRQKFCFDQWQAGASLKEINTALKKHPTWEHYPDHLAVRGPIKAWGKRIGVTPRTGHRGRQKSSK